MIERVENPICFSNRAIFLLNSIHEQKRGFPNSDYSCAVPAINKLIRGSKVTRCHHDGRIYEEGIGDGVV
mgnify:FL=1